MARKLTQGWLQAYKEYTEGTESPPIFHLWVALGTIAGAAQRKLFLDAGYFQIHTNMYIILVSPPGRSRKSTSLRIGKGVLKAVTAYGEELYFSTQASSVAALVRQMTNIKTKEHQSLTAFSSELGSLLGTKSVEMIDWLVDIYDCNPDWDKQTVGRGLEKIERPWFNLLAATTPQWMGDNLSRTAIEGGFVSRSIFVYDDTRLLVAFPEPTAEQKAIQKALVHDLAHIAKIRGEFTFHPDAKQYYKEWYENPQRMTTSGDYKLAGYYERKHIHVLKVAMAVSLSYSDSKILQVQDIQAGIGFLEDIEPGMRRAFSAVGKNIFSTDMERMKIQIFESGSHGKSYRQLLHDNIDSLQKEEFDRLLSAMVEMGEIERCKDGLFRKSKTIILTTERSNGRPTEQGSHAQRNGSYPAGPDAQPGHDAGSTGAGFGHAESQGGGAE